MQHFNIYYIVILSNNIKLYYFLLTNHDIKMNNHNGVITQLEPDILECEVKRALGSITTKKASGGDGIPAELFQILKMFLECS